MVLVRNKYANPFLIASWLWYIYSAGPWHNLGGVCLVWRAACISLIFRLPGNLFRLFGDMEGGGKTGSRLIAVGLQSVRNLAEMNCCWPQQLTRFLRDSGKVFPPSSARPLRSRRQGDFWGLSLLTHTPVILSGWVTFPSC